MRQLEKIYFSNIVDVVCEFLKNNIIDSDNSKRVVENQIDSDNSKRVGVNQIDSERI
ncbi:hypothetical protein [Methanosarcina sp. Kolksee]|uniref:hypothetical protein n=1 Tax=Methanosarcina sp. Kolksee TaxID=1434099 RepID=UPI000A87A775|nr:hypothetical protein [Methanosarcina sp. Kolksee]